MPELHLFIVWPKHYHKSQEIQKKLSSRFDICIESDISRTKDLFFTNFKRLYGKSDSIIQGKVDHCGIGTSKLYIVSDPKPIYEERMTSSGSMYVNINTFDLKEEIRASLGGGHTIHATNDIYEFNKDISLLAGKHGVGLIQQGVSYISQFPSQIYDPIGTHTRKSLAYFFTILQYHSEYIVMRNYYDLPHEATYGPHGDIDILCRNQEAAISLLNGYKVFHDPRRVHYKKHIGDGDVFFDLRSTSEDYYQKEWCYELLERRKLYNDIFIPTDEDHFWSLLYHALIHKKSLSTDYIEQLKNLDSVKDDGKDYNKRLYIYMRSKGYIYTIPKDISVYYNYSNAFGGTQISVISGIRLMQKMPYIGRRISIVLGYIYTYTGDIRNLDWTHSGTNIINAISRKRHMKVKNIFNR